MLSSTPRVRPMGLGEVTESLGLAARSYTLLLKVEPVFAYLDNSVEIEAKHLVEAIQCRSIDRKTT